MINRIKARTALPIILALAVLTLGQSADAIDQTWKNTATDFNSGASWVSGTAPGLGDRAIFSGPAVTQPNLSASVSIASLLFGTSTSSSGYDLTSSSTSISLTLTSTATSGSNQAITTSNSSGTNTIDAPIVLGAAAGATQTFSIASGGTLVINGIISEANAGIKVSKTGAGTLTLYGNNSFSGGVNLTSGTIAVGSDTALGSGPLVFGDGATLRSADTNTRTLANVWSPAGGTSNTIFGSATTGDLVLTDTTSFSLGTTVKTFTVNNNSTTLAKVFTSSGAGNGLTKEGSGKLVLNGASTYTGVTTINAGTLALDNNNTTTARLAGTSSISVNSGGTLLLVQSGATASNDRVKDTATMTLNGGTFNTAGLSEHGASNNTAGIGALTLQSSSVLDLANGASVIAFANSSAATWTAGATLSIYNWSGTAVTGNGTDQVYFGTSTTGLTALQLSQISFYSDSGTTFLGTATWGSDLDGEIVPTLVPVPEPSTWIGAALAVGAIGFTQRRRLRSLLAQRA